MAAGLIKRSVTIAGHRTSISLEPIFWAALREAAEARGTSLAALVAEIDEARSTNLSSAIRVWLFEQAREEQDKRIDTSTLLACGKRVSS